MRFSDSGLTWRITGRSRAKNFLASTAPAEGKNRCFFVCSPRSRCENITAAIPNRAVYWMFVDAGAAMSRLNTSSFSSPASPTAGLRLSERRPRRDHLCRLRCRHQLPHPDHGLGPPRRLQPKLESLLVDRLVRQLRPLRSRRQPNSSRIRTPSCSSSGPSVTSENELGTGRRARSLFHVDVAS